MYNISLTIIKDNPSSTERLDLTPTNGYYVETVEGLTGIESKIITTQQVNSVGESFAGYSIIGKALTIKGLVLDQQTAKKQALLDFVKPARELYLCVYRNEGTGQAHRLVPYRRAKCVVKNSPIITQEKHSKFSIVLTMPFPYWIATTKEEYTLSMGQGFVNMYGDTEPDFEFSFTIPTTQDPMTTLTLYHGAGTNGEHLDFDFSKASLGYVTAGDAVKVFRENGRFRCTINGIDEINVILYSSTLWTLPLGTRELYHSNVYIDDAKITYYPCYAGVLVDGV
jgi:hypothetical protein